MMLVDDAGALADQPLTHPMQRLQIELLGRLGGDEFHRRALYRLGDCFCVAKVVLLPLRIGPHVFRRHQPRVVALHLQSAAQVMGANAGLHPDQARRHVRKSCLDLAARPPLPQHDRATLVEADDMKRVLADVDAHRGNGQTRYVGHGDAPLLLAPFKHHSLEWREHGRTIPLADFRRAKTLEAPGERRFSVPLGRLTWCLGSNANTI